MHLVLFWFAFFPVLSLGSKSRLLLFWVFLGCYSQGVKHCFHSGAAGSQEGEPGAFSSKYAWAPGRS